MVFRLVFRSILHERARLITAVIGVAAAVGLLAWHLGLTYTAISQGLAAAERAAAPWTAWIAGAPMRGFGGPPPSGGKPQTPVKRTGLDRATAGATMGRRSSGESRPLPDDLLDEIDLSPLVERTCALSVHPVNMDMRPGGRVLQGPPMMGAMAVLPESGSPFAGGVTEGRLPKPGTLEVAASLSLFGRRVPKPELGSPIPLMLREGMLTLTVVGFFDSSSKVMEFPTLYTTEAAMREFERLNPTADLSPNLLLVKTATGKNPAELGLLLDEIPEADDCRLGTCAAVAAQFRNDTVNQLMQSLPLSLSLALITAACMLGTVLTIGLTLRRKRIAELRCAGMTRSGVLRLLLAETALLLLAGWMLGLALGCGALQIFLLTEPPGSELPRLIAPGWQTPVFTALLALLVGTFAVVAPAVQSIRVRPLEAVGGDITRNRPVSPFKTAVGLLLLLPLPLFANGLNLDCQLLKILMIAVGIPCFIAGFLLCIHPAMRLIEAIFLKPISALLGLDWRILSRRVSRDPGRALGTLLTLTLGLGGFIAIRIWGGTLMSCYTPSPEWPDVIVSALPSGLSRTQAEAVSTVKGVDNHRALPIECSQFPLAGTERGGGLILVFGVDPDAAFGGEHPLMRLRLAEGNRDEAVAALRDGNGCIIPAMLSRLTGLHLGDELQLSDGEPLKIAGVVELNWHMVTSRAQVRTLFGRLDGSAQRRGGGGRTMGMCFTSETTARRFTGNRDRVNFLWLNLDAEESALHPLQASVRLDSRIRSAVKDDGSCSIKVHHRDEIADGTIAHGNDILGTMARIPFWSLVVTSTGIIALLIASAQSSKQEIRTFRAIGMTRGQLAALFFGEAALIILCSLALSLFFGGLVGWSFTALTRWSLNAGLPVTLDIPWAMVLRGTLFAAGLCLAMSVLPLAWITKQD